MAEVFSVATGAIGVVGVAGQVIDGVRKLSQFCSEVSGVPKKLTYLTEELHDLATFLVELWLEEPEAGEDIAVLGYRKAYQRCHKAAGDIASVVLSLQQGLRGRKVRQTWSAVKAALKEKELKDGFEKLERAKTMLSLVQQSYLK